MKRLWIVASVLFYFQQAFAQSPHQQMDQAGGPTVVALAFSAAVLQTAEAKRDFTELQAKFASRQAHLQALSTEVEALRKEVNAPPPSWSDTEKRARQQSFDLKDRRLQREAEDYKADTDNASQQTFQTVAQKVLTFLQQYAKQHGYSIVIDRGSEASPNVWFAAPNSDITEQLTKAYDLQTNGAPIDNGSSPKPPTQSGGSTLPSAPAPH